MNQTPQSDAAHAQKTASQTAPSRQPRQKVAAGGRLAQLAATMSQSPRVQAQFKLAEEIQNSARVQAQLGLAAQMNPAPAAQLAGSGDQEETSKKSQERKKPRQRKIENAPAVAQLQEARAPNRTGLPDRLKAGVENLSGLSLDDVKVHYNSAQPAQLNALAYAQGSDIHVAPGQEKHLPHEAWHIVQQKQGRVRPTTQMKEGIPVNDEAGLEKEADVMGVKAVQAQAAPSAPMDGGIFCGGKDADSSGPALPSQDGAPLQPKWLESQHGVKLKWDSLLSGLRWYFNSITGRMSFHIEADVQVPMELWQVIEPLEGESRTYEEWAASGIFREGAWSEEDRQVVPNDAPQPRTLSGARMAVNAGVARAIALRVLHGEPGLDPGFAGKNGGASFFIASGNPYTGVAVDQNVTVEISIDIPPGRIVFDDANLLTIHVAKLIDVAVNEFGASRAALGLIDNDLRRYLKKEINKHTEFSATFGTLGFASSGKFKDFIRVARKPSEQHLWNTVGERVVASGSGVGLVIMGAGSHVTATPGSFLVVAPKAILKCFVIGGNQTFADIFEALGSQ